MKLVHSIHYEYEKRVLAYTSGATTHCFRRGISQCSSPTPADLRGGQGLSPSDETSQEVANYVCTFFSLFFPFVMNIFQGDHASVVLEQCAVSASEGRTRVSFSEIT